MSEVTAAPAAPAAAAPEAAPPPAPVEGTTETKAPAAKPEAKPADAPKVWKVKVDGQEMEVDEAELLRGYSISKAGYKRLEEVQKLRSNLESFVEEFKADPVSVMRKLAGQDKGFREQVEKYLIGELEREKMSPEQRALEEANERIRLYEEQRKREESERRSAAFEAQKRVAMEQYDREFTEALADPSINVPKTPTTVRRMAELTERAVRLGLDLPAKEVARIVKQEYLDAQRELLGAASPEVLSQVLGPDIAKKLRQAEVAALKAKPAVSTKPPSAKTKPTDDKPQPKRGMSEREWDAAIRARVSGQ